MSFLKGVRESPGMVVRLGENPKQGRAPSTQAHGHSEAKDLIFGEPQPAARQQRPPLQPANARVDASAGPAASLLKSKVGPGRQRRQVDESEVENIKRFQEEAIRGFQDARQARQQTKEGKGRFALQLAFEQQGTSEEGSNGNTPTRRERSLSRRPSRERTLGPTQVDPEMAELLGKIENTAELHRVDSGAQAYWDAQAAAEKCRTRNYRGAGAGGGGIFGDAPEEETLRSPMGGGAGAGPRLPQGPAEEAAWEARAVREQTFARNRGTAGGIFAKDPPMPAPPPRNDGQNIINHRW